MYILKFNHPLYGKPGASYSDREFKSLIPKVDHKLFSYSEDIEEEDDYPKEIGYIEEENYDIETL